MIGLTGLFQRIIRTDQPQSSKRAIALLAAVTLCLGEMVLILAVFYQAVLIGHVDGELNVSLGLISGSVAGLAGVAYRKPEATTDAKANAAGTGAQNPQEPGQ
jgi:hypothetical protein